MPSLPSALCAKCPDCFRKISLPYQSTATVCVRRTCRTCRTRWQVIAKPIDRNVYDRADVVGVHVVSFVRL